MRTSNSKNSGFLIDFLRNLGLFIVIGVVLFILFPDMMHQILQLFGALLTPALVVILIVVAALPRKRRR